VLVRDCCESHPHKVFSCLHVLYVVLHHVVYEGHSVRTSILWKVKIVVGRILLDAFQWASHSNNIGPSAVFEFHQRRNLGPRDEGCIRDAHLHNLWRRSCLVFWFPRFFGSVAV